MTAPDESGINKDCTEKSTDWIATDAKRCTDGVQSPGLVIEFSHRVQSSGLVTGFSHRVQSPGLATGFTIPIWIGTKFENPFKFTFLAFTLADLLFFNIRTKFEIL